MDLLIPTKALYTALAAVRGAIASKATLPMLSHVLVQAQEGQMTVTGTDLGLELRSVAAAEVETDGSVAVAHEQLLALAKVLPLDSDAQLTLAGDRLLIRSRRSRYRLAVRPAEEFPALDPDRFGQPVTLPSAVLSGLLDQVAYAMARNDVRHYLNGALLQVQEGALRVVASDGHRLATVSAEAEIDPASVRMRSPGADAAAHVVKAMRL